MKDGMRQVLWVPGLSDPNATNAVKLRKDNLNIDGRVVKTVLFRPSSTEDMSTGPLVWRDQRTVLIYIMKGHTKEGKKTDLKVP